MSDTTNVYPWETVKIDCIISASGASNKGMHICLVEKLTQFTETFCNLSVHISNLELKTTWQPAIYILNKVFCKTVHSYLF